MPLNIILSSDQHACEVRAMLFSFFRFSMLVTFFRKVGKHLDSVNILPCASPCYQN